MISIEDAITALRDGGYVTEISTLQKIAKDLNAIEKEVKEAKGPSEKTKTRLAILVRGDSALQQALAGGAWVVTVPDGENDPTTTTYYGQDLVNRLRKAVAEHNDAPSKRGRKKAKIVTWQDAFTTLSAKTIKASGSQVGIKMKGNLAECVVLTAESVEDTK